MSLVKDINELDIDVESSKEDYNYIVKYMRFQDSRSKIVMIMKIVDLKLFESSLSIKYYIDNPDISIYEEIQSRLKYISALKYIMLIYDGEEWDFSFLFNNSLHSYTEEDKNCIVFFYNEINIDSIIYKKHELDNNLLMYNCEKHAYTGASTPIELSVDDNLWRAC